MLVAHLPPTCAAHGLNNGPDGCCEGDSCSIEHDNSVCFCDRKCHANNSDKCCTDVISNGCYRE